MTKFRRRDPFVILEGTASDANVSGTIKQRWIEEIYSGEGKAGAPLPLPEFLGVVVSRRRLFVMVGVVAILLLIIWGRLFYLQILRGEHYYALAENNRLRVKPIPAERGLIYSRDLTPLLANIPNFTLNINPQDLPKDENKRREIIQKIASMTQLAPEKIQTKIEELKSTSFRSLTLRDDLDYQTALLLTVASADLPGLEIAISWRRQYYFTSLRDTASPDLIGINSAKQSSPQTLYIPSLSHLLGYIGKVNKDDLTLNQKYLPTDFIGKTGLEKSYEKILRGVYGKKEIEVDALGKEKNLINQEPPLAGKNLILTLDLNLQKAAEEALTAELRASGKKRGAVIVLNPQNGEILALVNWPSFDNNFFSRGLSQEEYQKLLVDVNAPLFSRAWSGTYPSGSIIKPIIAAAALAEGLIKRQTTFLSAGGLQVSRWFFPDWKADGHGPANVIKALAESVNTFFYIIGGGYQNFTGLGLEKITEYLKKFGLANTLGLDLPGEAAGFIPSREWKEDAKKERWYIGDTYNLSIGQGDLLVTPLQVASYTATIANNGTIYAPRLVKAILDSQTNEQTSIQPKVLAKSVVSEEILKIVRQGMRATVTSGSALRLSALPVAVAGKTGTAQWSPKFLPHAWFTGFAPYDNPQIVVTVLVEEGGDGSSVAAPIAGRIFSWWWRNK